MFGGWVRCVDHALEEKLLVDTKNSGVAKPLNLHLSDR